MCKRTRREPLLVHVQVQVISRGADEAPLLVQVITTGGDELLQQVQVNLLLQVQVMTCRCS